MSARSLPEHLNVPWKVWEAVWVFVAGWFVVRLLVVIALSLVGHSLPAAQHILDGLASNNAYDNFGLTLISAATAMVMVGYFLHRYHAHWRDVGWRKFNLWQTLILLLIVFGVFVIGVAAIFALVKLLIPTFNAGQSQANDFGGQAAIQHPWLPFVGLVIIPPILEETVFRGFIFPAIAKKWGLIVGAILTSLLFGIAHLQANVSLYTFVLSLLLCFMYWRLKSIIPGIALHMLNNLLAYLALTGGRW